MEIEYFLREEWETFCSVAKRHKSVVWFGWLDPNKCHDLEHAKRSFHYNKRTVDIEYDFPFWTKELYGLAYRTDFDLSQHEQFSGKELKYRDPVTNEVFTPHVLEPTFGVDRSVLAVLCEAYTEEEWKMEKHGLFWNSLHGLLLFILYILPLMKKMDS